MNQFALTKSIDTYLKHNNLTMIEQSSWNNGVVVFKIEDGDGLPKSLVVIYLEKDELHLKDMVKQLYGESSNSSNLIQCTSMYEESVEDGIIIYIVTERVNQLVDLVLDGGDELKNKTEEEKKIYLYEIMYDVGMSAKYLKSKLSKLNIFVNNEELCVDNNGKGKLLLFDLIKNQVMINNEAYEISRLVKQVANGLGTGINIDVKEQTIEQLNRECLEQIEHSRKKNQQYKLIFQSNIENAKKGDEKAQYVVGYMYYKGKGVPKDYIKAAEWYKKSAEGSYTKALNNLAYLYQKGKGVNKDIHKAEQLLLKSAKQGDDVACLNLGILYQTGKLGTANMEDAEYWYRKAMDKGNPTATRIYRRIQSMEQKEN